MTILYRFAHRGGGGGGGGVTGIHPSLSSPPPRIRSNHMHYLILYHTFVKVSPQKNSCMQPLIIGWWCPLYEGVLLTMIYV